MYARLFTSIAISAAFDDAVQRAAVGGRVERMFATLASTELGLPTLKDDGNPVGKPAFLTLASEYREQVRHGKRAGFAKRAQRVDIGVALDAIAIALDPSANVIGTVEAWMTATEPKPRAATVTKATPSTQATSADDSADEAAPITGKVDADRYDEGYAAGHAAALAEPASIDAGALHAAVIDALSAGAFTGPELVTLAQYVADAQAALVREVAALQAPAAEAPDTALGAALMAALGAEVLAGSGVPAAAPVASPVASPAADTDALTFNVADMPAGSLLAGWSAADALDDAMGVPLPAMLVPQAA
jgi:hypothetical protein